MIQSILVLNVYLEVTQNSLCCDEPNTWYYKDDFSLLKRNQVRIDLNKILFFTFIENRNNAIHYFLL